MNTVRVLLEQEPSRLFLSLDEPSERERRQPSELRASSLAVRFRRRPFRRFARATLRHFRRHASGGSSPLRSPASFGSRIPMARPPPAHAARTCPCGVVCTALHLSTAHPHVSADTKKGDGFPSPSWVQIPTLPTRARRFRAWTNPTPVQLP